MNDPRPTTRRRFLETLATGAAVAGGAGLARGFPANSAVQIGVIGCGGRARGALMPKAMALPETRVTALCDVYRAHLAAASRDVEARYGTQPFTTPRHEELLARKDVDAVIVATPDHWHVPISVAACESGKDVYCEKPLTHSAAEGPAIVAAQDRHQRVVQIGTQQRSMPQFARARELIRAGRLGRIHKIHMSWNRNFLPFRKSVPRIDPAEFDWKRFLGSAPEQPFDPYRAVGNWRWFWDFGSGILGDLMVHWLDAVNWILDLPAPRRAVTAGEHCAAAGVWETPDTIQTLLEYPERQLQIHFEGTFVNQHEGASVTFMGTDATLYADRGRYEILPEPGRAAKAESFVPGKAARGADFDVDGTSLHLAGWLECIRARRKPVAPAEAGVLAAEAAHLGNAAYRERRVAERDS